MAKRFGRTLILDQLARSYAYDAHIRGSDHADLAGNCQTPVMVSLTGMRDRRITLLHEFNRPWHDSAMVEGQHHYIGPGFSEVPDRPRHIDVAVRCRKCENCLKARRRHWQLRAVAEMGQASRTWFGTLTLRPDQQFRLVATARDRLRRAGTDYDDLSHDEQFIEDCKALVHEVQKYLKRLRKETKGLRYLWVIERHKTGAPHVHMLLHETVEAVRHRQLQAQWPAGFTKFNLVAEGQARNAAFYVTKYLTKSLGRLFASQQYGVKHISAASRQNKAELMTPLAAKNEMGERPEPKEDR